MPVRIEPKPCAICGTELPKQRNRFKTCSAECSATHQRQLQQRNNLRHLDTELPEVQMRSKWLTKAWRLVA